MYPIAPHKSWTIVLTIFLFMAIAVFGLSERLNWGAGDWRVASISATLAIATVTFSVGSNWYYSPWRMLWRRVPQLNRWVYPDLNGIWVGKTHSNWPTIKKMFEAAQCADVVTDAALQSIPEQEDSVVMEIRASLFGVQIEAYLESTKGKSLSVTARPYRDSRTKEVHLVYVYEQVVPDPDRTDECAHLGAAELVFGELKFDVGEGVYWTRRRWKLGLNTAGKVRIELVARKRAQGKALAEYL